MVPRGLQDAKRERLRFKTTVSQPVFRIESSHQQPELQIAFS
jgi:hypothetical protein